MNYNFNVMGFESKILCREISTLLWDLDKTVGTAESCTGGRIAEGLASVPGASRYFKGGIVCYTDEVKHNLLGVNNETLAEKTAVSEEVVIEMVKGACKVLSTDYALATTGYAGPTASDDGTPVGTIWVACGTADEVQTLKLTDDYGRDRNLEIATTAAMRLLYENLKTLVPDVEEENSPEK